MTVTMMKSLLLSKKNSKVIAPNRPIDIHELYPIADDDYDVEISSLPKSIHNNNNNGRRRGGGGGDSGSSVSSQLSDDSSFTAFSVRTQDTLGSVGSTRSGGRGSSRRKVSFVSKVKAKKILRLKDYTEDEKEATWYDEEELNYMRLRNHKAVQHFKAGTSVAMMMSKEDEDCCIRGLEQQTDDHDSVSALEQRRVTARDVVFQEQETQRSATADSTSTTTSSRGKKSSSSNNSHALSISKAYAKATKSCRIAARIRGQKDEQAARHAWTTTTSSSGDDTDESISSSSLSAVASVGSNDQPQQQEDGDDHCCNDTKQEEMKLLGDDEACKNRAAMLLEKRRARMKHVLVGRVA